MTHPKHHEERLLAYADAELSPRDAADLERHLAECPACAENVQRLREGVAAIESYPRALSFLRKQESLESFPTSGRVEKKDDFATNVGNQYSRDSCFRRNDRGDEALEYSYAANALAAIENRLRNRKRRRWAAATAGIAASAACALVLMTGVKPATNPPAPASIATAELAKVDESLENLRQLLAEYEPAPAPKPRPPAPKIYAGAEESAAVILAAGRYWEEHMHVPNEASQRYRTIVADYALTQAAAEAESRLQRIDKGVPQ